MPQYLIHKEHGEWKLDIIVDPNDPNPQRQNYHASPDFDDIYEMLPDAVEAAEGGSI